WNANTPEMQQHKAFLSQVMAGVGSNIPDAIDQLEDAIEYYAGRLDYHLNLDFDGRTIVGDDPNNLQDSNYGNNDVTGPSSDKEDIKHGTHVAGIIAAERNNNTRIKAVANNVQNKSVAA